MLNGIWSTLFFIWLINITLRPPYIKPQVCCHVTSSTRNDGSTPSAPHTLDRWQNTRYWTASISMYVHHTIQQTLNKAYWVHGQKCYRTCTFLQMVVEYLCTNLFLLICCSHVTRSTGRAFHQSLEPSCRESLPFSGENIREVGRWCWPMRPGSLSALLFNPKGLCSLQSCSKCRLW